VNLQTSAEIWLATLHPDAKTEPQCMDECIEVMHRCEEIAAWTAAQRIQYNSRNADVIRNSAQSQRPTSSHLLAVSAVVVKGFIANIYPDDLRQLYREKQTKNNW